MLEVGPARNEGDLHIGEGRPGQHAKVLFFFQMGQHQPLPVFVQHLFPAVGGKLHAAAAGQGFQLQVHFRVMAQRLIVAHALHGLGDGLLVQDAAGAELHFQPEPLGQQAAQHLQLDLAHQLDMDLAQRLVPHHMELGLLFFQPVQLAQCRMHVGPLRQQHLIAQHRFQHRQVAVPLCAQSLAGAGLGQAGHGTHLPGANGLCQRVLGTGIQPQLVGFFGPGLAVRFAGKLGFHLQFPAGDPQPGQARALLVLRHLEHLGSKGFQRRGRAGVTVQPVQQGIHTLQLEGRPEPAREHMPPRNGRDEVGVLQLSGIQHPVHQVFVAQGQRLVPVGLLCAKVHKAFAQAAVQLGKKLLPLHAGQVHLIHEHKSGHMVAPQQPPERLGMALHAIGAADHQHRVIQHLQGALRLGGKIHMARCVQQGDVGIARCEQGLFGKDGDATLFFQRVGVQKGVLVIHPAQAAGHTGAVEHGFRQGGLAGVHMGQNAQYDLFAR